MKKMDGERTPLKAKSFIVNNSKRGKPKKRWKETTEKVMLAGGSKRSDAQDRAVW